VEPSPIKEELRQDNDCPSPRFLSAAPTPGAENLFLNHNFLQDKNADFSPKTAILAPGYDGALYEPSLEF